MARITTAAAGGIFLWDNGVGTVFAARGTRIPLFHCLCGEAEKQAGIIRYSKLLGHSSENFVLWDFLKIINMK